MKGKNNLWKITTLFILFLLLIVNILPSVISLQYFKKPEVNDTNNKEFNLIVSMNPARHILPRLYSWDVGVIAFFIEVANEGPDASPDVQLTFEVKKSFGKGSGEMYNEIYTYHSLESSEGLGRFFMYNVDGWIGVFKAKATINIDDTNLNDNTKSFYFIMVR